MVRYVGPRRAQGLVLSYRPEVVVHDPADAADRLPRASAWVVGSGVADHRAGRRHRRRAGRGHSCLPTPEPWKRACDRALRGRGRLPLIACCSRRTRRELVAALAAIRHIDAGRRGARPRGPRKAARGDGAGHCAAQGLTHAHRRAWWRRHRARGSARVARDCGFGRRARWDRGRATRLGFECRRRWGRGAWVHARAAEAASGGGPIVALDIADALPAVVAELLLG